MKNRFILGIDTSNYKTSVALTDIHQNIVCDLRKFLKVKQGEKGLRQSDALFQHVKNLPELFEELAGSSDDGVCGEAANDLSDVLAAVAYSSRPRPVEGSYMPVFIAGESFARSLAALAGIPALPFSHQEGHIEAIKAFSQLKDVERIMACHFSGGTSELLEVTAADDRAGYGIEIIGGSKDIAFGQVIDRAGVTLGMDFPAGEEMDRIAEAAERASDVLTRIKVRDGWLNLSGIDTQIKRTLENSGTVSCESAGPLIREIFEKVSDAMTDMVIQGAEKTGVSDIIMAGGVTSSVFIRKRAFKKLDAAGINAVFDENGLAQDNAVGISVLGGKEIWGSNL